MSLCIQEQSSSQGVRHSLIQGAHLWAGKYIILIIFLAFCDFSLITQSEKAVVIDTPVDLEI